MRDANSLPSDWSAPVSRGLIELLRRSLPPDQDDPMLDRILADLTAALAQGITWLPLQPEQHLPLHQSGWLNGPRSPLVLNESKLAFRRWHEGMETLVLRLLERVAASPDIHETDPATQPTLEQPTLEQSPWIQGLNPEQLAAVAAIRQHRLVLLSGGPGTGKTSTVVRMLAQVVSDQPELRIGLAAPTGKAAGRLQDAIRNGRECLPQSLQPALAALPCATLHRWLEAGSRGFGRHQRRPLPLDLLVVDEMSMVDLNLATALLEALPETAQLVLVGDAAQLPPIGAGAVWQHLQEDAQRQRFGSAAIELHRVYRNRGALARLSGVLRDQGIEAFWRACRHSTAASGSSENLQWQQGDRRAIPPAVTKALRDHLNTLQNAVAALPPGPTEPMGDNLDAAAADQALDELDRLQVLCPRRVGAWGVDMVHRTLLPEGGVEAWPPGVPVLCAANQPELGLANGDRGLTIGAGPQRRVLFRCIDATGTASPRLLHPARLKALEPALALTVHKAQGSEADHVLLLWPGALRDQERPQQECALLYTAITRARQQLLLLTATDPAKLESSSEAAL